MSDLTETIALIGFLPVVLLVMGRWRSPAAAIGLVFAAVLFLPPAMRFDLPGLPPLGKASLPYLYVLLGAVLWLPRRLSLARPGRGLDWLFIVMLAAGLGTALTNRDGLTVGIVAGNKLTPWDAISMGGTVVLEMWLPFVLGRAFVRSERELTQLLVAFVVSGLVYSVLCLFEIRMSPQLHNMVYGGHASPFWATRRLGGYRPTVFMSNGLAVGTFMVCSFLAAVTLARVRRVIPRYAARVAPYLGVILVLVKSTAAILYGLMFAPLLYAARHRLVVGVLAALMTVILTYPILRTSGVFPTDGLVSAAELLSDERAESLEFRFANEDIILTRALARPWFGWGAHGRHMVFDEVTGEDISTVDGYWILMFATRGVFAWLAFFSLAILPVALAARRLRRISSEHGRLLLLGLAAISVTYTLDLLPNGLFSNLPLFLSGALVASSRALAEETPSAGTGAPPAGETRDARQNGSRRVRDLLRNRAARSSRA
ncbi:MAG TPA: hypothetical protein VFT98_14710 [Myxococcota bacterium]|nr:hypothetical protein [Myxococcota bacterium]